MQCGKQFRVRNYLNLFNMKKITTFLLCAFLACNLSYAGIVITKNGKGPNGYYTVNETHNPSGSTLTCFDPGNTDCNWVVTPTVSGHSADFLANLAEVEIANGNHSGTIVYNNQVIITWSGTAENHTINLDIYNP